MAEKEFKPSLAHLRAQFLEHLLAQNMSQYTISSYNLLLDCFYRFLEEGGIRGVLQITKKILEDYQIFNSQERTKAGKPMSAVYQNMKLKVAKYFCRFVYEKEYIKDDLTRGIRYAKEPKRLPRNILSEDEVLKILKEPDLNVPLGFRDRTILEVLYSTGVRKSELLNLDLSDVDYKQGMILIRSGKGRKDRYLPVGRIASQFLESYIHHIRAILLKGVPSPALFVSLQNKRLSKVYLNYIINKYAKRAGIKKKITSHSFRHTCATHLVNRGMDIRHIQTLLGHSCLSSTQIYTKVGIKDLKKVVKKYHPREKVKINP